MKSFGPVIVIAATALAACDDVGAKPEGALPAQAPRVAAVRDEVIINPRLLRRFQPLPASFVSDVAAPDPARIELGRRLFFETRLSRDGDLSCNSCHELSAFGVDGEKTSAGHKGQRGSRNSPTVYNAAGAFAQFWDGRARDAEEQAKGPLLNPIEMAMVDGATVVAAVRAGPGYAQAFARAFPGDTDPVTLHNVGKAIGAFERGLVTPGRWDRYLRGEKDALTNREKEGLKTFLDVGCMVCHTGPLLGGSMFERVGVVEPWPNQSDRGRAEITKNPGDAMMFKVPTLRNIAKTAPYFHDGSAATLPEAVQMMGRHQLGLELTPREIDAIVSWLESLTGELPSSYIARPPAP